MPASRSGTSRKASRPTGYSHAQDGWGFFDQDAIEYLTYAVLAFDAALVMLTDSQPVLFPRTLCLGIRTANRKGRKRNRRSRRG